ncbi:MAG: chromosome partitioning protein ParB [Arenimonas sp. SCN 70-307]|uniref:ParB/RepB/Spo0J family partition protein n=1 Tax=Arenimonas sp. SCN 70-307 TaxID=1660089 RepID=UPI00086A3AA1|nr:ParB/RepB/Spo0J family partition protein [Arenimonas sp. SCN 70-307]ODS63866.1 MAG: chromosome partitioning protein ParB [Arenimonas sp. SCN 70-307]
MSSKKRGLGRGLDALLGTGNKGAAPADEASAGEGLRTLPLAQLQPGKYQPRSAMDPAKLTELAESIKAQGLIQPIVVRAIGNGKDGQARYEIIAGERRWRAATQAGLTDVPVVLREVDDRASIAMALIENIQREDLNPLEEALALSRLIDEFSLTHQQAAEAVGRSRASVSNLLRLLELPEGIRKLLEERQLEMGHARALLTLAPQAALALAREAVAEGWSVREVERRAQLLAKGQIPGKKPAKGPAKKTDADIAALERELSERLGAKVAVQHGRGGRGKLVISYHGLDTLDGILERLRG